LLKAKTKTEISTMAIKDQTDNLMAHRDQATGIRTIMVQKVEKGKNKSLEPSPHLVVIL
jgi:hypothetical protein